MLASTQTTPRYAEIHLNVYNQDPIFVSSAAVAAAPVPVPAPSAAVSTAEASVSVPTATQTHQSAHIPMHRTPNSKPRTSTLIHPRPPILLQLRLPLSRLTRLTYLHFDPLPCPQHFTLQVETPPLLRIVQIEQPFKPFVDDIQVPLPAAGRGDVQNAAGFVQGQAGGGEAVGGCGVGGVGCGVFLVEKGRVSWGVAWGRGGGACTWEAEACL